MTSLKVGTNCAPLRAHKTYSDAIKKGDDGRKDFVARKSCNYLEDAIEVGFEIGVDVDMLLVTGL